MIYYIYHRYPHHSQHSGYAQITKYLPGHRIEVTARWESFLSCIPKKTRENLVQRACTRSYRDYYLGLEIKAMLNLVFRRRKIFYVLEADNCFSYLGDVPNWGRNLIVGAYHQPPSFFNTIMKDKNKLKRLDGIITFSRESQYYFQEIIGADRVFFTPHGVDVDYFQPKYDGGDGSTRDDKKRCLFVGHWLRDFNTLKKVIKVMNDRGRNILFTIITFKQFFNEFDGLRNVELLCAIPDEQLLTLYHNSDLLLLPLKDSTANNVILEAMACGLPVVTTDVGGIRDYLDDRKAAVVKPGDADTMADVVEALLDNPGKRKEMVKAAREHVVQNYQWPHIAEKTRLIFGKLYESIK